MSQNACQASQASLSVYFNHKYTKPKVTVRQKQQIQGNSEDESDVEQSVSARVNVKGTMPGDVQKHTRVLRPCKARGCCAPPKKLICQDESSSEDEYERKSDYVQSRRGRSGGDASVHGRGRRRGDKGEGGMFAREGKGVRGVSARGGKKGGSKIVDMLVAKKAAHLVVVHQQLACLLAPWT